MEAAGKGHTEVVVELLNAGASPNVRTGDGTTALREATVNNQEDVVRILLEHGADVNAKEDIFGTTCLMEAARVGSVPIVKLLLQHGADVNAMEDTGFTALTEASLRGHLTVVNLLKQYGAW